MSGQIEHEMTDCLEQMAQLQAKMEVLQQEKNNKAAEEVAKQNTTEPNLGIMSNWLNEYGEIIDEVERERVIVEQYKELERDRERGWGQGGIQEKIMKYERIIEIEKLPEGKQKWRELRNFVSQSGVGVRIDHDLLPQLRLKYQPTQEEYEFYNNREMITEKYLSLQNKKQSSKTKEQQLSRAQVLNNSPNFIPGNHQPTYFMKQYIEATHNMFVIQQKRINELETIIKKIEMNSA